MKRRLSESLEAKLVVGPHHAILTEKLVEQWGGIPYASLSVLLSYLKFIQEVHHNHHLIASSHVSYSDHLLFQRLYENVLEEIDKVAEKAVGLGSAMNVQPILLNTQVCQLLKCVDTLPTQMRTASDLLAKNSYAVEMSLLCAVKILVEMMQEYGELSRGVDNLLAGVEDQHEEHVYLLKMRLS